MKPIIILFFLYLLSGNSFSQVTHLNYNKELADSLGADPYGMKNYYLIILKTGKIKIEDKTKTDSIFKGHMSNISKLVREGKLIVAGPFKKNELTYRGLFIFSVKNKEEALTLLNSDPVISSGIMEAEILEWYGSAALPMYLEYHKLIEQNKIE